MVEWSICLLELLALVCSDTWTITQMAGNSSDTQTTGNIGLYFTCYRLSLLHWNVMPTARNARGIDIVAYNRDSTRYIGVQVKALTKRIAVPLGASLDKVLGDYWVIVNRIRSGAPNAFLMLPADVRRLAVKNEANGRTSYWLEPQAYEHEGFRENWNLIGNG